MKLSITRLKYLKSLHQGKHRQKYHNFIVEGVKLAGEVLQNGGFEVEGIFALPAWVEANQALLASFQQQLTLISEADLERISLLTTPNQVLMVLRKKEIATHSFSIKKGFSLFLENIQDPGNFGTIWRTADWFGATQVFHSSNCAEPFSPKVIQASMGAFLRVPCVETDLDFLTKNNPELTVYGAVLDGENVFNTVIEQSSLLVIGNESKGISPETLSKINRRVAIPKPPGGGAESLNAAVAAGILSAVFCEKIQ